MIYDVCVAGAGASGMTAALTAARQGARVLVLERLDRAGRKILATGNGRCNLDNKRIVRDSADLSKEYRCSSPGFPERITASFDSKDAAVLFRSLGILTRSKGEYMYPAAMQASVVRDALERGMEDTGRVTLVTGAEVSDIETAADGTFNIFTLDDRSFSSSRLILSCGGCSSSKLGSNGSGYRLCEGLGHRIITPVPALCALKCRGEFFKSLAGVRTGGRVTVFIDGEKAAEDSGELQLTSYGISGIPTFQVSRYAAYALLEGKDVEASLDFMPDAGFKELKGLMSEMISMNPLHNMTEVLSGLMNSTLAATICSLVSARDVPCGKSAGTYSGAADEGQWHGGTDLPAGKWSRRSVGRLVSLIKGFRVKVTGTNGFENSQVSAGGVDVTQVDPTTMRSLLVDNLYITGELLDVDGICGGYNLHWAWATGYLAGRDAGKPDRHNPILNRSYERQD